jgi:hypothetical protein
MADRYDLVVARKGTNDKTFYQRVGIMLAPKDGSDRWNIKLEAYPLPNEKGEVWIAAYPPKDNDRPAQSTQRNTSPRPASTSEAISDDIPF